MKRAKSGYVLLYQYGSNMSPARLNTPERLNGRAAPLIAAKLEGWGIRFDLYSETNDSAVTDIVPSVGEHVMGVLYEVPLRLVYGAKGARAKMDRIEGTRLDGSGNYQRMKVTVTTVHGERLTAVTYIGTDAGRRRFHGNGVESRRVQPTYFGHLFTGAQQFNFEEKYIAYLRERAGL